MTDEHIIGEWKSRFFLVSFGCHLTMNHYEECLELFMKKHRIFGLSDRDNLAT